jgi:predicted RNA-binding protein associated with RNAse of E/G family
MSTTDLDQALAGAVESGMLTPEEAEEANAPSADAASRTAAVGIAPPWPEGVSPPFW